MKFSKIVNVLCLVVFMMFVIEMPAVAEDKPYAVTKIVLDINKNNKLFASLSKHHKVQNKVKPNHFAIDDNKNVYLLDIFGNNVFKFSKDGNPKSKVSLQGLTFPYKIENIDDNYLDYFIETSTDGTRYYITDGTEEYKWSVLDATGVIIRTGVFIFSPLDRTCGQLRSDNALLDNKLNTVKQITKHVFAGELFDSTGNFYSIKNEKNASLIIKRDVLRKEIWKRQLPFTKSVRLIGVDGDDNLYVFGEGPNGIAKVSKDSKLVRVISFPQETIFTNVKSMKGMFKVICDGSIYYFPNNIRLFDKGDGGSSYSIYRFSQK